jgi:hypothetical protein
MMIKASGRSALIVAAGLLVCFAGPLPARAASGDSATASKSETATSGKSVGQSARHWKRYAHRKYARTAAKSSESSKASEKDVADAGDSPAVIPASVANANAQMTSTNALANALADSASAMTAKANTMLLASADKPADAQAPADAAVVASDQLNDVDRALQETPAKQQTVAMASAAKPVAAAAPVLAAANDSSTWDQTSLIGKIFIAFGALLTMASAARMFMA